MIRIVSLLLMFCSSITLAANKVLILGDSLSAGYNMPIEQAWPSLLSASMAKLNHQVSVVNASISGDTTGNGLARLPSLLKQHQPDWIIVELGANDGLRGFSPNIVKHNLSQIIILSQQANAKVALMQIRIPPNYGKRYTQMFEKLYPTLTDQYQTAYLPFFLEQVILRPEWMMADGLHPKSQAQPWIADFVADAFAQHLNN